MSQNRSEGWRMFFIAVFVLFFWGGKGLWGMPYAGWDSIFGKCEVAAFLIACLFAMVGFYKGVTGR